MRTLTTKNGTKFHYNSDLSGNVFVLYLTNEGYKTAEIDGLDLLEFVSNFVMRRKIEILESASTNKILGIE